MPASPQAIIPNMPTLGDALRALSQARNVVWDVPRLVTANGQAFPQENRTSVRFLQNCGTTVVKYKIGSAITGADDFHGILAACTAQDDGLGSVVNLSHIQGPIFIAAVTGSPRVSTIQGTYET